ncbi:hypothetical protein C7450_101195 [Chelatococcus asaccharovorans]|uniref:Uncharacterized protein n=2 Tax=Chelatococcus asaccharovorans TaxID=28210 RepID=A0A2V3UI59_9HYPH|nr:hypothetical protein [Chelatococcus asaccharovorans]PXW64440.1 hypothetical protein C7450_101195 [Chelatococcus asaccharovorans]
MDEETTHMFIKLAMATLVATAATVVVADTAPASEGNNAVTLSHLDGRPAETGIENVNRVLRQIGVHIGAIPIPPDARPVLEASRTRAISDDETKLIGALFAMHRGQLLEVVSAAGRQPEAHRGGYLSTSEIGDAPYPKIFDMKAIPPDILPAVQAKYAKLHVNTSDDGFGIDEVMTVVSGGPWTWFFRLTSGEIVKLSVGPVDGSGNALRLSYSGLVPHAAFLSAPSGLTVAHAHGPQHFVMRYDDPSVAGADVLGTNPWIDFTADRPKLVKP